MKSKLLFTALMILGYSSLCAQDLADCKNPCKKTRIVQCGPLIGLRTLSLPDSQSVRVVEVVKHGASYKNGILLGDTLTHFNGKVIKSMEYFIAEVAKLQPGDTIKVTVNRMGIVSDFIFPLGAASSKKITEIECCDDPPPDLNNIVFILSLNPANDYLRVSTNENIKSEVEFNILDPNGNLLKTEKTKQAKGSFESSINISDLSIGVYFLKIFVENTQYVQRFRKEN
jgi:hypothetical protein